MVTARGGREKPIVVYVLLTLASALWAGNIVASKLAEAVIPTFTLAALRFVLMAMCLVAFLRWKDGGKSRIKGRDYLPFTILGLTGVVGFFILFLLALRYAPAADGALFIGLSPLLSSILAIFIAGEVMTWYKGIGLTVSLFGVALVIGIGNAADGYGGTRILGDLAFLGAVISWAVYTAYGRAVMRRFSALSTTTYSTALALIVLIPLAAVESSGQANWIGAMSIYSWALVIYMSIFAGFVAFVCWNEGVRQIGPSRAGGFYNLIPVFGLLFASVLLNEPVGPIHAVGAGFVILGAWLTNRRAGL